MCEAPFKNVSPSHLYWLRQVIQNKLLTNQERIRSKSLSTFSNQESHPGQKSKPSNQEWNRSLKIQIPHTSVLLLQVKPISGKKRYLSVYIWCASAVFELTNYRLKPLLSSPSKVVKKLIYVRRMNCLAKHSRLHQNQYGFYQSFSTNHALLDVVITAYSK